MTVTHDTASLPEGKRACTVNLEGIIWKPAAAPAFQQLPPNSAIALSYLREEKYWPAPPPLLCTLGTPPPDFGWVFTGDFWLNVIQYQILKIKIRLKTLCKKSTFFYRPKKF